MKKQLTLLLLLISTVAMSQMTYITTDVFAGYKTVTFLPKGFDPNKAYPVILSFGGTGQTGGANSDINKTFTAGLPYVLKNGFITPIDYLVMALQDNWGSVDPGKIDLALSQISAKYKIDTNRIYATGFSAGGATVVGIMNNAVIAKFAALVPFSSAGTLSNANFIPSNLKGVWCISGPNSGAEGLPTYYYYSNTLTTANIINAKTPGLAKLTQKVGLGHGGSWNSVYDTTVTDGISFWTYIGTKSKTVVTVPPTGGVSVPTTEYVRQMIDSAIKANLLLIPNSSQLVDGLATKEQVKRWDDLGGTVSGNYSFLTNAIAQRDITIAALKDSITQLKADVELGRVTNENQEGRIANVIDGLNLRTIAINKILVEAMRQLTNAQ